jgi:hypothetical protein
MEVEQEAPSAPEGTGAEARGVKRARPGGMPESVVVQFVAATGETTGPQIDLPTSSTPEQMEMIINQLRENPEGKVSRGRAFHGAMSLPHCHEGTVLWYSHDIP